MNSGLILYRLSALRYLAVATKLETLHPPSLRTPLRVIFFKKRASVSTLRTNRMITCVSKCRILNKKIQLLADVYLLLVLFAFLLFFLFNEAYSYVSYREINILANLLFVVSLLRYRTLFSSFYHRPIIVLLRRYFVFLLRLLLQLHHESRRVNRTRNESSRWIFGVDRNVDDEKE